MRELLITKTVGTIQAYTNQGAPVKVCILISFRFNMEQLYIVPSPVLELPCITASIRLLYEQWTPNIYLLTLSCIITKFSTQMVAENGNILIWQHNCCK